VTFGLALVVEELIKQVVGGNTFQPIPPQTILGFQMSGPITLPIVGSFPRWRLYLVLLAGIVIVLTYLVIERTDFGLVVQAGTRDSEMVRLLGIPINRSYTLVFAVGASLAAFAGLVGASIQTISPQIGTQQALIPAFLTIVVGGAGSVVGAIAGGMVLGLIVAAFQQTFSQWAFIMMYLFVALVLVFKPEGLFGGVEVGE
jgi:branched-chain amino acid transport system permease protein